MNRERTTATATGILFIVATIAALAASAMDPSLAGSGHLFEMADQGASQISAVLLYLVAAVTSASIAISLYPVLRRVGESVALGSVVFRTIEAVFYILAAVSLLATLALSQQFVSAPDASRATIATLADLMLGVRDRSNLVAVVAFSLGASMYYLLFLRARLVPRWLSAWGMAGALLMLAASLLAMTSDTPVTGYTLLILPILIQEMVLAAWLLIKGLNLAAVTAHIPAGAEDFVAGTANQPPTR